MTCLSREMVFWDDVLGWTVMDRRDGHWFWDRYKPNPGPSSGAGGKWAQWKELSAERYSLRSSPEMLWLSGVQGCGVRLSSLIGTTGAWAPSGWARDHSQVGQHFFLQKAGFQWWHPVVARSNCPKMLIRLHSSTYRRESPSSLPGDWTVCKPRQIEDNSGRTDPRRENPHFPLIEGHRGNNLLGLKPWLCCCLPVVLKDAAWPNYISVPVSLKQG